MMIHTRKPLPLALIGYWYATFVGFVWGGLLARAESNVTAISGCFVACQSGLSNEAASVSAPAISRVILWARPCSGTKKSTGSSGGSSGLPCRYCTHYQAVTRKRIASKLKRDSQTEGTDNRFTGHRAQRRSERSLTHVGVQFFRPLREYYR